MKHNDSYTIFFGDSELLITRDMPSERYYVLDVEACDSFSQAKIVKKVESSKYVAIVTDNPESAFERLKAEFKWVEAAGGVVTNVAGDLLMINLRGRWDLPKGRVEVGECAKVAASSVVLDDVRPHTTVAGIPAVEVGDSVGEPALFMQHCLS